MIYAQARMTTTRGDFDEIYRNRASLERKVQLVTDTLNSGHWSVSRGVSFTFSIAGVSRACGNQLVRHVQGVSWEQQCLTADSVVTFVAPDGSSSPNLRRSIGDLYQAWHHGYDHPYGQNAIRRRRLRVLNEETSLFEVGHIADIIDTGMQEVFTVELEDGKTLTMTRNHRIFTDEGWKTLEDAVGLVLQGTTAGVTREARVMVNGVTGGDHDTHRKPGWLAPRKAEGSTVQKSDDTGVVGRLGSSERKRPSPRKLRGHPVRITRVSYSGIQRTYDLSVSGKWHNFVANGLVVHNSQRYKQVDVDSDWHIMPPTTLETPGRHDLYLAAMRASAEAYAALLAMGVPAEDARMVLPNAARTNLVSTWSFEALKNFLGQRLCTRAQWEIRDVAKAMRKEVVRAFPWSAPWFTIKCIPMGLCTEHRPDGCPLLEENGGRIRRAHPRREPSAAG